MNLQEFMEEIGHLKQHEGVRCFVEKENCHAIRLSIGGIRCCPIEAVAYEKSGRPLINGYARDAGRDLGLSQKDVQRIMDAADNYKGNGPFIITTMRLRKQMLEMLDLRK